MIRRPYYRSIDRYWTAAESHRAKHGSLPDWVFDFVSVHERGSQFSLLGPSFVPQGRKSGRRPRFERKNFDSFDAAKNYALRLSKRIKSRKVHVVSCV